MDVTGVQPAVQSIRVGTCGSRLFVYDYLVPNERLKKGSKIGRPAKRAEDVRGAVLSLRLTLAEMAQIEAAAKQTGDTSPAIWARRMLLDNARANTVAMTYGARMLQDDIVFRFAPPQSGTLQVAVSYGALMANGTLLPGETDSGPKEAPPGGRPGEKLPSK
jgi:hypothetical protein